MTTSERACLHQRRYYDFDYRTDVCHDCGFRNDDDGDYWAGFDAAIATIRSMGTNVLTSEHTRFGSAIFEYLDNTELDKRYIVVALPVEGKENSDVGE